MCLEAYAAGIMDGDGSIQIQELHDRRTPVTKTRYRFIIYLAGCERAPIDLLCDQWGGGICETQTLTGRSYFKWWVMGDKATRFLEDILPYLVGKTDQALLALEFQHKDRDATDDKAMRARMRTLATRGKNSVTA
ncbi:hypothetical protein LCGC14_1363000 [marine sediment metagenome]|uniref:Homing endonuclease LAGLIDADG domain-containing protein n=1 Tax=marine sediment metagenome TaxID=412755 RepID=A0A0F9KTL6_9ZZZZ